jgi:two-component system, chemotaxis family, sensor kinase CheA
MAKDPYKYFRIEARELLEGLTQGVLDLEGGATPGEALAQILRHAHTLKGAARVVKQPRIAEAAHAMEDVLAPYSQDGQPVPREASSRVLALIDEIAALLSALEAPVPATAPAVDTAAAPAATPAVPGPAAPATPAPAVRPEAPEAPRLAIAETVRVEIRDMDALLESISEASVRVSALRQGVATRDPDQLLAGIERAERELIQLRDLAGRLRLVAASTLFAPLARATRDAADAVGKQVEFEAAGGDARLEAHVLAGLRDALLHVVRNAVAHGIEAPPERAAAGKPAAGRIRLNVERRANQVAFVCEDDGRGIDLAAVARAAVKRGVLPAAEADALDGERAARLIFEAGLSSTAAVDEVSGRGVGLDVVREVVARLKGSVRVRSRPGAGFTLEITVPISLSSLVALAADAGGHQVWTPLDAVVQTLRLEAAAIGRGPEGETIAFDGRMIPFLRLPATLAPATGPRGAGAWSVIVVRSEGETAAVGVDHLRGVSQVVVRSLPRMVFECPLVAGAAFDPEGNPQLVLSAAGLVRAARAARGDAREASPARRPPILVIDDSLTTRMLEQSILESAGYEVDLAVSAEEGLQKARERRYGLFLVDVEMPGMNGFEFVAKTRGEPGLRDVPAILVTSLGSAEHRRRGMEAGAHAHIVKGEFDEARLRTLIRDLIG